jgi:hypothetical protein
MYKFDLGWMVVGIIIIALGALIARYYNKLAEATGMWNYSRWQLIGFIVIGIGFIIMLNLHTLLLTMIAGWIVSPK